MKKILSAILCSVLIFTLSGCDRSGVKNDNDSKTDIKETIKDEEIKTKEVVLYFSNDQAMYLVGQKRNIEEHTAKAIILELIKGPSRLEEEAELNETLPSNLELLDVQVKEGIANVDLSGDTVQDISAGSAGEGMALYSIINTLILDDNLDITKVQFLVDGKKVDAIKGHYDVSVPISEDEDMIKK
ncbi:GerMN domain-containing protein [Clostridium sp.]|uniref:GerMN domain-containing protein n=1 Tax=Clostridium sp. TaxID=1506 RepID=UPI003F4BC8E5